jgi:hypothetical protein
MSNMMICHQAAADDFDKVLLVPKNLIFRKLICDGDMEESYLSILLPLEATRKKSIKLPIVFIVTG